MKVIIQKLLNLFTKSKVSTRYECGKYTECCRKINTNSNGRIWVETDDHLRCGKVQEILSNMKKWWDYNKKIKGRVK